MKVCIKLSIKEQGAKFWQDIIYLKDFYILAGHNLSQGFLYFGRTFVSSISLFWALAGSNFGWRLLNPLESHIIFMA